MSLLLLVLLAAALSAAATPLVRRLALRAGAVDHPGRRRVHDTPTPRLGGVAILVAMLGALGIGTIVGLPVFDTLAAHGWRLGWLAGGIAVIVATGVVDDVRGLEAFPKLVFQTAAGAVALAGGFELVGFTNPFTGAFVTFGVVGSVLTLVWILFVTNALNLIDGLDGLAAGVTSIAAATLLAIALGEGRLDAAFLWAVLLGAVVGFLPYNFNPASIFLGDTGSLLLGYLLAVLSLQSLQKGATAVVVTVPILALGLPIMEAGLTLLRRTVVSGVASVFRADQEHLHHRLVAVGMSHRGAVLSLYAVCVAFNALAFASVLAQGVAQALLVGGAVVALLGSVRALRRRSQPAAEL